MTGTLFSAIRRPVKNETTETCSACGSWWRLPLLLGLVLAAIVCSRVLGPREESSEKGVGASAPLRDGVPQKKVSLTVDFGDGRQRNFETIAWQSGMSVADAMKAASGVTVTKKGSGESAFVTGIDGVQNQGADGPNWTYSVNDKIADRSFAIYKLKPGDQVLWKFAPRQ
jgi:hypothetical protein